MPDVLALSIKVVIGVRNYFQKAHCLKYTDIQVDMDEPCTMIINKD